MYFMVTTPVNRQYDGMWEIQWAVENCRIIKTRYRGLFLIEAKEEALERIRQYETTAIYRVIPLQKLIKAKLPEILEESCSTAKPLKKGETFAVRCKRRGSSLSSKEIEKAVGEKIVKTYGNPVNLDDPDRILMIQIIDEKAGISLLKKDDMVRKDVLDL